MPDLLKNRNDTPAPALTRARRRERPVVPADRREACAEALEIDLGAYAMKPSFSGEVALRVDFKCWRARDDALALYMRELGREQRVRVLIFPAPPATASNGDPPPEAIYVAARDCERKGALDLRRVALGSVLSAYLGRRHGWPRLLSASLEEGYLLPASSPGQETSLPGAAGSEKPPRQVRRGLWTYHKDGAVAGVRHADGRRTPDRVLMSAWREREVWRRARAEGSSDEDCSIEAVAAQVECSLQAAKRHLRRARRLRDAGRRPGSRPEQGLRASDVSTYVAIKEGRAPSDAVPESCRNRPGLWFLVVESDGERSAFPAGHARIETAMSRPSVQVLRWTGLRGQGGKRIWEGERVRPEDGFPWQKVWWDEKLLRWQAGRDLSLATLASLAEGRLQIQRARQPRRGPGSTQRRLP